MQIAIGDGKTEYGPGVLITMTGDEVAIAIHAWLVAHGVTVEGPRTTRVNGDLCSFAEVYVDPSGSVISDGKRFSGRGLTQS